MPDPELILIPPPVFGSGKSATPWERMHWEYFRASSKCFWALAPLGSVVAVPPAGTLDEVLPRLATPADDEVVPHPARRRRPAPKRAMATRLRPRYALLPDTLNPCHGVLVIRQPE
jgi:hypothetical protein